MVSATEASERRERGLAAAAGDNDAGLPELAVFVLGTFNLDLLPPFLVEALERVGLFPRVTLGPFGQLTQEIANPESALYRASPAAVLLVPAAEDLLEAFYAGAADERIVDERLDELRRLLETALGRLPQATFYVVAFGPEDVPSPHVLDPGAPERGQVALERFLAGVRRLAVISPRVAVVDWEWAGRPGGGAYRDARLWYLARMRLNPPGLAALADAVAEHVAASRGDAKKVVAVDLDGLLWGGVVGEVGLTGIELREDGIGLAYKDLQRELVKLTRIGVLLVACSKNNPSDVDEVLDRHPGMVVRREHLSALRVDWRDKATNLRELAEELGLGLDSFVFLDDNPVEREWVRKALPEVAVPELPADPAERPAFLRRLPFFRRTRVTDADARRAASYRVEWRRRELRGAIASFDEFLAELGQEAVLEPLNEGSLARAAQLAQRTNQFNLTNRRYTVAELEALIGDPATEAYTLALSDRFGDSGTTGLAILRFTDGEAEVDTLLLSCRVLGRHVEDAFLAFLAERAHERGARALVGRYVGSARNEQVRSFYPDRGFDPAEDEAYRLDLERRRPEAPATIAVRVATRA
jgi:FkbH-like protein